nr:hypothetical protein [Polymorphobacter sp.]
MTLRIFAFAAAFGLAAATAHAAPPAPQAVTPVKGMNYDCTKAGNKTKAACKNVTPSGTAATARPAVPAATTPAAAKAPMNYDCTKAGNKTKADCKNVVVPPVVAAKPAAPLAATPVAAKPAAAAPAPKAAAPRTAAAAKPANPNLVAATQKNGKVVHYDCSKAGNKDKTACKSA